jgi:hypothetical protein
VTWFVTLAGAVMILLGLYDIFRTLFLPTGKGLVSKWIAQGVWHGFRALARFSPGILTLAGPISFIASAAAWALLLIFGWACIYWPQMPDGFNLSPGMNPDDNAGFLDGLYLSVVTIATLGYGDISPGQQWLRFLAPIQALVGFLLFTAIISWLLSIYPDLGQRQSFAREVSLLRDAEQKFGYDLLGLDVNTAEQQLGKLTTHLVTIHSDLLQFPVTYYFHTEDEASSLPAMMLYVVDLAGRASQDTYRPEIRFQAARLQGAVDDFAKTLATDFLGMSSKPVDQVLVAYAREHFHHQ